MLSAFFRFVRCMCMCVCVYLDMCTCLGIHWIVMFQYLLCRPTENPLRNQTSNRFYSTFCVCCKKKKRLKSSCQELFPFCQFSLFELTLIWNEIYVIQSTPNTIQSRSASCVYNFSTPFTLTHSIYGLFGINFKKLQTAHNFRVSPLKLA